MNNFQQATLEQLVSYKAKNTDDIQRLLQCEKLKNMAVLLCEKWNKQRTVIGLEAWND